MSKVQIINSASQLQELIMGNNIVVIDFFATWCGPCKAIAPAYEQLATSCTESGKMVFTKVDVDKQKDIAQAYQITAMPTFVVLKNGAESDRVQGSEMQKLGRVVRELIAESGGSQISASSSASGWSGAQIPKGYKNINSEIEVKGLDCMNWKSELGSVRSLFEPTAPSGLSAPNPKAKAVSDSIDWMESDTDEQLMLFIPFQSTVKVFQLQITSLPPSSSSSNDDDDEGEADGEAKRPRTIKIYTNNPHILGFEEAESRTEQQTITLSDEDWKDGTATINTKFVKFQAVSTLTIFIVDAEDDAESARVDRLKIIGESGQKKDPGKLEKVGEDH